MIEIHKLSPNEFWAQAGVEALIDAYADECALAGLPRPAPDRDLYDDMNTFGALRVFGAFRDDTIIGFAVLLVSPNLHYGILLATMESLFVAKGQRSTGAGLMLLRQAEQAARDAGAQAFLVCAPVGSSLEKILTQSTSFRETNRVFCKGLA
ncbi:MAG: GNAT family N-acetyltransferase [Zoogloeaceae bacterium]|jgi:GNAT superfamily N-acetyltransferase|nr:GNAT family N-acetyltransferase [Zoogloeaceae bacterium]